MQDPGLSEILDAARIGFAGMDVDPAVQEAGLAHLARWLTEPAFAPYRFQIGALIEREQWPLLLDSFRQVLPFGTGGRRGPVGIGPNRFNPWTLAASVQGHAAWLRKVRGEGPLTVVVGCDVRVFLDQTAQLVPGVPNPVRGMTSRDFAAIAAEVYAAAGIAVVLPPEGTWLSTPELSFTIRFLGADGGVNISASHNPPDDNGSKFYNAAGAQEVPPDDEAMAREVEGVTHVERMPMDRARAVGLIRELGPEVLAAYRRTCLACGREPAARSARVVFSGLHGLGRNTVVPVLQEAGFEVLIEPSQAAFDGGFSNVPFRAPNPEVRQALDAAIAFARSVGADLVLATDPDADRLGLAAPLGSSGLDGEAWRFFDGNEIAALVCHAALRRPRTARPLVLKSEVTSRLVEAIARAHGAAIVPDLLVGFKYIAAALDSIERTGRVDGLEASLDDFVAGVEESHGVLVTPAIRDKDAAGGALLLAELASLERARDRTLADTLADLWREHGYVRNLLVSTVMRGAEGREAIQRIQASLRADPPTAIGGRRVSAFRDRQDPMGPLGPIRSETDRASRDVLAWELGERARVVLRPSGTEPKVKVYVEVAAAPGTTDLNSVIRHADAEARALAEDFTALILARADLDLPRWAMRASDLVALEHKQRFARRVLPELISRLENADPTAGRWLDAEIAAYGQDSRGLVAGAVRAWLAEQDPPPRCAKALEALFDRW